MKKCLLLFLTGVLFVACKQQVKETDLPKINGYWEIEKVELPDGSKKEYKVNSTIDFFQIKGMKGMRKKVMPQLDGSYLMNDLSENIVILNKDGDIIFKCSTPYAKWSEELMELTDNSMVIKNDQDLEYHYKKAKPFSVK